MTANEWLAADREPWTVTPIVATPDGAISHVDFDSPFILAVFGKRKESP